MREEAWPVFVGTNVWRIHEAHCEDLPRFLHILDAFRLSASMSVNELFRHVEMGFAFPGPDDPSPEEGAYSPDGNDRESASRAVYKLFQKTAGYFDSSRTKITMVVRGVRMPSASREILGSEPLDYSHRSDFRVESGEHVTEKVKAYVEMGSQTVECIESQIRESQEDGDWLWAKWEWECLCRFLQALAQAVCEY